MRHLLDDSFHDGLSIIPIQCAPNEWIVIKVN